MAAARNLILDKLWTILYTRFIPNKISQTLETLSQRKKNAEARSECA